MGELVGSAILTFLLLRLIIWIQRKVDLFEKKTSPEFRRKIVAYVTVLILCTTLGSFNFGAANAFFLYGVGLIFWAIVDVVRFKLVNPKSLPVQSSQIEQNLRSLKDFHEKGLISEQEFEKAKAETLSKMAK